MNKRPPASPLDPALARFLRDELGTDGGGDDGATKAWSFAGPLWIWRSSNSASGLPAKTAWYFITIDGSVAAAIRAAMAGRTGGFGSVRVEARVGDTVWQTSLFPSRESGGYLLPMKAAVRRAEGLAEGTMVRVSLALP